MINKVNFKLILFSVLLFELLVIRCTYADERKVAKEEMVLLAARENLKKSIGIFEEYKQEFAEEMASWFDYLFELFEKDKVTTSEIEIMHLKYSEVEFEVLKLQIAYETLASDSAVFYKSLLSHADRIANVKKKEVMIKKINLKKDSTDNVHLDCKNALDSIDQGLSEINDAIVFFDQRLTVGKCQQDKSMEENAASLIKELKIIQEKLSVKQDF